MKTVYLNDHIAQSAIDRLKKYVNIVDNFDHPEDIDAIIIRQQYCTKEMIDKAINCKLIQMHGTGMDRIDVEEAKKKGIPVLSTHGGNAQSVAELTVAFILATSRKLTTINNGTKEGRYKVFGLPETEGSEVYGKTIGFYGSGQIALMVANIMKNAFHCNTLFYNPHLTDERCRKQGIKKVDSLEELVEQADFFSIHVPLTNDTYHSVNKEVLSHSKKGMILINTARGGIVDEDALFEALKDGTVKAAAMDVFEKQPPEPSEPLLQLDNFIGTIHIGGSTKEALERNGKVVVDNVFQYLGIEEEQ